MIRWTKRGESGRVFTGLGALMAVLGAILVGVAAFVGGDPGREASPASAQEAPDLQVVKDSLGQHSGGDMIREYRIMARNNGGELEVTDEVTIVDQLDPDLVVLGQHDVNGDWSCSVDGSNTLECELQNNPSLGDQFETIIILDVCDTEDRGSVPNSVSIFLNDVEQDENNSNPNVFACEPTPTPTATNTAVATSTEEISTSTPTNTPVNTNTPTNTPEDTATPTNTPEDTATPTNTPEDTATPTNTPEDTATPTPTNTTEVPPLAATDTPEPTATEAAVLGVAATATPTATEAAVLGVAITPAAPTQLPATGSGGFGGDSTALWAGLGLIAAGITVTLAGMYARRPN